MRLLKKSILKKHPDSKFARFLDNNIYVMLAFICSAVLMLLVYYCFDIIPFAAPSYSVSRHAAHKDTSKPTTDEQKPQPPQQKNLHTGSCWGEGHWCLYDMEFPEDKSLKCIGIIHIELGSQNICDLSAK